MSATSPLGGDQRLLELVVSAIQGYAEISLTELFGVMRLPSNDPTLGKVQQALAFATQCGLEIVPGIEKGDLATARRLRLKAGRPTTLEQAQSEVTNGESSRLEFKSSVQYDHRKALSYPSAPLSELRSESVLHSCLKTVAAFLNSQGGILYIGVGDSGRLIGIASDLLFLDPDRRNTDNWELIFRDLLKARFKEGETVNDYVRTEFIQCDAGAVARVEISPRKRLSFLKYYKDKYVLYRRQGNRTEEVTIDQVEEFLALRTL
jgi:hypothetical protein